MKRQLVYHIKYNNYDVFLHFLLFLFVCLTLFFLWGIITSAYWRGAVNHTATSALEKFLISYECWLAINADKQKTI